MMFIYNLRHPQQLQTIRTVFANSNPGDQNDHQGKHQQQYRKKTGIPPGGTVRVTIRHETKVVALAFVGNKKLDGPQVAFCLGTQGRPLRGGTPIHGVICLQSRDTAETS